MSLPNTDMPDKPWASLHIPQSSVRKMKHLHGTSLQHLCLVSFTPWAEEPVLIFTGVKKPLTVSEVNTHPEAGFFLFSLNS